MERMTLKEIAAAIGADGTFEGAVDCVSTDTRALPPGCLFGGARGRAVRRTRLYHGGAAPAGRLRVAHERRDYGAGPVMYVKNTQRALMDLARAYRARFDIHCVGITGSVGKTTTKDMVASVVSAGFQTLKTEGNLNNEIGLPKTLARV